VRYETVLQVIARIKMLGIEDLGLIAEQEDKGGNRWSGST